LEFPTLQFYRTLCRKLAQIDVVNLHALWNPVTTAAAAACRKTSTPYVISPLGMLRDAAVRNKGIKKKLYYGLLDRHTVSGAAALTFFTEADAAESLRNVGKRPPPYVLVPNGVDTTSQQRAVQGRFRAAHPELCGKRLLLFLGRLHSCKNLTLQLDAFALLAKKYTDLAWVLVGPDDGEWGKLSSEANRLALKDRVFWMGLQPHQTCLDALADADVCVLTSHHEGHSMAMNEALAAGVPLVLTHSVGFACAERAGAAQVVTSDAARVAEAVARILDDPTLARNMSAAARSLVESAFAWPKVANRLISIYEKILTATPFSESDITI
jgi:glycosyltransferase involved in cell wall biosynthesis